MDCNPSSSAGVQPRIPAPPELELSNHVRDVQLHLWQKVAFLDDGTDARKKADSIRLRLAQLQSCHTRQVSSGKGSMCLDHVVRDYLQLYSQVMDKRDESKGMNNLFSPVEVLTTGQKNECKSWKSRLTYEAVMDMPEVKLLLKQPEVCDKARLQPVYSPPSSWVASSPVSTSNRTRPSTQLAVAINHSQPVTTSTTPASVFKSSGSLCGQISVQKPKNAGCGPSTSAFSYPTANTCNIVPSSNAHNSVRVSNNSSRVNPPQGRIARGEKTQPHTKRMRMSDVVDDELEDTTRTSSAFITARDQYAINQQKQGVGGNVNSTSYGLSKKSLGTRRAGGGRFVPPVKRGLEGDGEGINEEIRSRVLCGGGSGGGKGSSGGKLPPELEGDDRLKSIEPRMVELIMNEIMDYGAPVQWDDIAGLQFAKSTIKEIVVWPMMRPDIFKGLRGPPKGILLFGPPGTGKTLIGKCIASQVNATFFSISASSLTSKWVGEGEKMVRALFAVARCYQPAVIFIDEIDSLLSQRSDTEHESSRRIKTEFLVQLDGATSSDEDKLLVIGATNRPQEIDEAARRRLVKRLYIPLPDSVARKQLVTNLMKQQPYSLSEEELELICTHTEGYSGADMANLCREAAYGPVREAAESIQHIAADEMRPIHYKDFENAILVIRPSVTDKDLGLYVEWNRQFGCGLRR